MLLVQQYITFCPRDRILSLEDDVTGSINKGGLSVQL